MKKYNIFDSIVVDKKEERFFEIFKNDLIKIEKIVSNGQSSPKDFWYIQEDNEFVILLKGFAIIEFEDKDMELNEGDYIIISALQKHRVKFTSQDSPTIWLAVFYK
ncbi:MAG: cupin domain-containing protein [Arcobacteraceae bacterium]|jgi:cupin 2 domain-containing protein|nr:cupin domain-containing protein [Arcobacteraceae bacterium]MDY0364705.1 cupin domain-containing protein [Arcobacteraceae bacterium]